MSALPSILFAHAGAELYGADRILVELVAGLKSRGHSQEVVLPGPGPLHAELQHAGVHTHQRNLGVLRRRYFTPSGLLNRARRLVTAVRFMRKLIRDHGIQVVHTNTTAVLAAALAARFEGVPHVWHVHEITTRPRWFARAMARCVSVLSNRVVFVSEATRSHMCSMCERVREKSLVIYNGIDTTRVLSGQRGVIRTELGFSEDQPIVGMVGRINWWKGQDKLMEAAARLAPRHPQVRFLMVGGTFDGDERALQTLKRSIASESLDDRVVIQDFRNDIGNVLADIDVFVLPSTEPDPFPTVVLEAMAAGKAIVAFRHGGVCEMVEDGRSGILCTPGSAEELASAIARLLADPDMRRDMGFAARMRLASHFTREAFISRFSDLYVQVASRHVG